MAFTEALKLVLSADVGGAVKGLNQVGAAADKNLTKTEQRAERVSAKFTSVGAAMLGVGAAAAFGLVKAAQSASDLEEAANKSATVFGKASGKVEEFAESAQDIGLSEKAALDAAGSFGNLFTQVGLSSDAAADMSTSMTGLAADFASFHNADITQVLEAQQAAFRGEYDAVQRFVPTINAAAVEQRALADSTKESAKELTAGEKAAATYSLILEGAGKATGDFERTSGSAANTQRRFSASLENMKASVGEAALPVLEDLVDIAGKGVKAFTGLNDATGGAVGKLATFGTIGALALGGLSLTIGQITKGRDALRKTSEVLSGMPSAARRAAFGLGLVGAALATMAILTSRRESRAEGFVEDLIGDVDPSKLRELRDALAEAREELDRLDDREGKGRLFSIGGANVFATGGDADRQERIEQLRESIAELEDQEQSLAGSQDSLATASLGAAGAIDEGTLSSQAATAALEAYEAQINELTGAHLSEFEAATAWGDAITGMTASLTENGLTLDINTEQGRANREALANSAQAALDHAAAVGRETGSVDAANFTLAGHVEQLKTVLRQSGLTEAQIEDYIAQLGLTPENISTAVQATGVQTALALLDSVQTKIRQLDGSTATVRVNARATSTGRIGGVPIFHRGTHSVPGRPGSEMLAYVQAGERIISAGMANMGGGGGSGAVYVTENHYHIAGSVWSERELMGTINRQLDGGARLGRHGRDVNRTSRGPHPL